MQNPIRRTSCFFFSLVLVLFLTVPLGAAVLANEVPGEIPTEALAVTSEGVVFQDFEDGWGFWYAENGMWDIGEPNAGPSAAHNGTQCAGTNLDGNYPLATQSRLISPYLQIPEATGNGSVWLRFWHWFSVYNANDIVRVQIKESGGQWQDLSTTFFNQGGDWTVHRVDLADYEGLTVQLGFLLDDDGATSGYPSYSPLVSTGWYLDDLELVEIPITYWNSEDFEAGIGDWYAEHGTWAVGQPTSGPSGAHGGQKLAGTQLNGNYPLHCLSRLISPPLALPASPTDGVIRLRFWQWFSIYNSNDLAKAQIRPLGGDWVDVSREFAYTCGGWTQFIADLSSFAGQTVEIGFLLDDDSVTSGYPSYSPFVSPGWYLDDLSIVEGAPIPWSETGFEFNVEDWYADGGLWQLGNPSGGPGEAASGSAAAGTVLGGNYTLACNSRLISPPITLEGAPVDGALWFSFWHWFSIYNGNDIARVEIQPEGGDWEVLSNSQRFAGGVWSRQILDVAAYAGQTVRFAFHIQDDGATSGYPSYSWYVSSGWYVDNLKVFSGKLEGPVPQNFENGDWGLQPMPHDWFVEGGVWEVGEPTAGPGQAHGGKYCAGTNLGGNYTSSCDSRLISPEMELQATPVNGQLWLSFWHWFSIYNGNDIARVELRTPGGEWEPLSQGFAHASGHWTQCALDLTPWIGQTVQFSWRVQDDGANSGYPSYSPYIAEGWYVDNIGIVEGPLTINNVESFEDGSTGWIADAALWQIGPPTSGPGSAYSGENCVGTVLDGNYTYRCNSRLASPPFVVPNGAMLRFFHWFSFYGGDSGQVEISVENGEWTGLASFVDASSTWSPYIIDLTPYAGQQVRIGFKLADDGANSGYPSYSPYISSGWYIDDFYVLGSPEGQPEAPDFLSVDYSSQAPLLTWGEVPAATRWVAVYAGQTEDFVPDLGNRVALVEGTSFVDVEHPGWYYRYKISMIDDNGFESMHVLPAGVSATPEPIPASLTALNRNFPNPFNPTTTISFGLAKDSEVKLSVFDVRGRLMEVLLDDRLDSGAHVVTFNGEKYGSGVYFFRLETDGFLQTRKMTLVK